MGQKTTNPAQNFFFNLIWEKKVPKRLKIEAWTAFCQLLWVDFVAGGGGKIHNSPNLKYFVQNLQYLTNIVDFRTISLIFWPTSMILWPKPLIFWTKSMIFCFFIFKQISPFWNIWKSVWKLIFHFLNWFPLFWINENQFEIEKCFFTFWTDFPFLNKWKSVWKCFFFKPISYF